MFNHCMKGKWTGVCRILYKSSAYCAQLQKIVPQSGIGIEMSMPPEISLYFNLFGSK
ncbi:16324_t:CDS:2 [Entrophospora sp. SA101]|nr:16324_t:CDS:2 [Entrophospora sp. SA101]